MLTLLHRVQLKQVTEHTVDLLSLVAHARVVYVGHFDGGTAALVDYGELFAEFVAGRLLVAFALSPELVEDGRLQVVDVEAVRVRVGQGDRDRLAHAYVRACGRAQRYKVVAE